MQAINSIINTRCFYKTGISAVSKSIISFLLVFNLSFSCAPSFTSERIAILVLMLLYWKEFKISLHTLVLTNKSIIILYLLILSYALFQLAFISSDDTTMLSRIIWFIFFSIFAALLFLCMCNYDLDSAMRYFVAAILIQSICVVLTIIEPGLREWVSTILVNSGNVDLLGGVRFSGFSNGGGAGLSLQLSIGVLASLILYIRSNTYLGKIYFLIVSILIAATTIFVGRTGLYVSMLALIVFAIIGRHRILITSIVFIMLYAISQQYFQVSFFNSFNLEGADIKLNQTLAWAFELLQTGESSSLNDLLFQISNIREMTISNLLFGSGKIKAIDGGNFSGHDSGYVQILYALGLPVAFLLYGLLFVFYYRLLMNARGIFNKLGFFFLIIMFIAELKEPFIFKYTFPFFILIYTLSIKNQMIDHRS